MTSSTETRLQKENDELRKLTVRLGIAILRAVRESTMLLRTVLERESLRVLPSVAASPVPEDVAPDEMALLLCDAAMLCAHLSRASNDGRLGQEFENLSVELADAAQHLKTLFDDPVTFQQTNQ